MHHCFKISSIFSDCSICPDALPPRSSLQLSQVSPLFLQWPVSIPATTVHTPLCFETNVLFSHLSLSLHCWLPGYKRGFFIHCLAHSGYPAFDAGQFYSWSYNSVRLGSKHCKCLFRGTCTLNTTKVYFKTYC